MFDEVGNERLTIKSQVGNGIYERRVLLKIFTYQHLENCMSRQEMENLCKYAERFPADFQTVLYKDLLEIPDVAKKLAVIPYFRTWMS